MTRSVRPFHVSGSKARAALRERARAALAQWARQWAGFIEPAALDVELRDLGAVSRTQLFLRLDCESGCAWLSEDPKERERFMRAVTGDSLPPGGGPADSWIEAAATQGRRALAAAVTGALLGARRDDAREVREEPLPKDLFAAGAGSVEIRCESVGMCLVVDRGVWRATPPSERESGKPRGSLVPLQRAAARARVRLEVTLKGIDIELPRLLDVRRGDVLRLPQRLSEPLSLRCDGLLVARAALGVVGRYKGAQVAPVGESGSEIK